ncbi:hypothetical protein K466DRAFT_606964 [Polyporus arcularius HHB13444]|uniref:XPG-I domain-containing protein n=1 Tax=Polyporus arcularius HHB13444 TaxID=1314778 RepID=A0A5C3NN78_9APHY|nr:hypothetical protein K466DRAFT_606964 [Polyporus arcularius HHB13444]
MFGANVIIHNSSHKEDKNIVSVYCTTALQENTVRRTCTQLILIAVLAGGDYNSQGLQNCGVKTARGLARYGLGDTLLDCINNAEDDTTLVSALAAWRQDVCRYLRDDPDKSIGQCRHALAQNISKDFPAPAVMLCKHFFVWDKETLCNHFHNMIWPGAVLQLFVARWLNVPFAEHGIPLTNPSGFFSECKIAVNAWPLLRATYGEAALVTASDRLLSCPCKFLVYF